jgi:hypothetical protein
MTDAFLRANGYFIDVDPLEAYKFIDDATKRKEFNFPAILEYLARRVKPLEE